jgi:DNA mismatch endonuclease (patch repair protein)
MSRIRGRDTTPERLVRSLLHKMGYRFRLNVKIPVQAGRVVPRAPGRGYEKGGAQGATTLNIRPDIVLPKYKTAIFVHGCFWHRHRGCKNCTTPTHRREWWLNKLNGNAARDKLHQRALRKLGWHVLIVWECDTEKSAKLQSLITRITVD